MDLKSLDVDIIPSQEHDDGMEHMLSQSKSNDRMYIQQHRIEHHSAPVPLDPPRLPVDVLTLIRMLI